MTHNFFILLERDNGQKHAPLAICLDQPCETKSQSAAETTQSEFGSWYDSREHVYVSSVTVSAANGQHKA